MNTHRVKILNRAYDAYIICSITKQFQFKFFPTQNCFFYQHFMYG